MGHHHIHKHRSALNLAAFLNLGFALSEFVAGWAFNSTALLSDAVHDMGDVASLFLSAVIAKISKKKPTEAYSYGFGRLSLLTAILNSFILLFGTALVVREAIEKLANPEPVNSLGMFVMSIVGIAINLYAVLGLKGSKNILERSVMLHLMEDLLGWIAVFVCAIVIYFTDWYILDPIASLGISAFVLVHVFRNLYQSYQMIMMRTSDVGEMAELIQAISEQSGVIRVFDCHYWSLDGEKHIFTAKVQIESAADAGRIRQAIKSLSSSYPIACSTIELVVGPLTDPSPESL